MKSKFALLGLCLIALAVLLGDSSRAAEVENSEPPPPQEEPLNSAAPTNVPFTATSTPEPSPQMSGVEMRELFQAYLKLQQQFNDSLMADRDQTADEVSRSTESVQASLRQLQSSFVDQRKEELAFLQSSNRSVLAVAGVFAGSALLALVAAAWLQLRAVNRLADVAAALPSSHLLPHPGATELALEHPGSEPNQVSARLHHAVQTLEHRIRELEITSGPHSSGEAHHGALGEELPDRVSVLLGKGQTLLHLNDPDAALRCFDEAMHEDPGNPEVFIKKGTALEKLRRLEEAIQCYDRAIELNEGSTLAYLYKGGVYNQLERFDDALQCYEQALRSQQKSSTATTSSS